MNKGAERMAKVFCVFGKICSGKSTYAEALCRREQAVLLSIDEIMLSLFGQHCGEMHDTYADRCQKYLLNKAVTLAENGINVALDWGFWKKEDRARVRHFFAEKGIETQFLYIDISDATWRARINQRNLAVQRGETRAYYVDENLAAKFLSRFETPDRAEVDIWLDAERS